MIVSIPPRSNGAEIQAAIVALTEPQDEVHVMASSLLFAAPREICGLRALIECAAANAAVVTFDCPLKSEVHRYLGRMDFYSELPSNVRLSHEPPIIHRRDQRRSLIELRHVTDVNDLQELMDSFWGVSLEHLKSNRLAKAYSTALGAVAENVVDHAASPIGALVAAQRYERTGLELCVVDVGHGIPVTLRRNAKYAELSDIDAVVRALDDRVTSTGVEGRGAGLAELCSTIAKAGSATLTIQSGCAQVTLHGDSGRMYVNRLIPGSPTPGTWITLLVQPSPNKRKEK
jgi:anti-sigma regulatory factor (Ser/Thr protein kinase)